MKSLENLRNKLIDRIMVVKNENLLVEIENMLDSTGEDDRLKLNSHQIEMLLMSEKDIENGHLISDSDLRQADSKWMS